jgi:hypothetical protein
MEVEIMPRVTDEFTRDRLAEREEPPVQPAGDVVERMRDAYYMQAHGIPEFKEVDVNGMTAAYQVARAQVIAEALSEPSREEIAMHDKVNGGHRPLHWPDINWYLAYRRQTLTQADKPCTKQERVEEILKRFGMCNAEAYPKLAAEIVAELEKAQ